MGHNLAIDETSLSNGELYTIITNKEKRNKSKIVAMVKGTKASIVSKALEQIPFKDRVCVAEITADLDNSMDWICRTSFPNARKTADRFHVQKIVAEAMQEVRIAYRREAIKEENTGVTERYHNGDSKKQLLARSRYLLFKPQKKWTISQKERASILFSEYPSIRKAYDFYIELREIYEESKTRLEAEDRMNIWLKAARRSDLDSISSSADTIEYNLGKILNYFEKRETNASAEGFNAKLKRFRGMLRGVNNLDFFLFRVSKLYA